jgi:UDP-N-acetylmuramate dehydrogenase
LNISENQNLKHYHTFGIDVSARYFVTIDSEKDLELLFVGKEYAHMLRLEDGYLVIGEGSNVLFTKYFNGCIIHNNIRGIEVLREQENMVWVRTGAGERWHEFVLFSIKLGWGGIENLSLIPGTVGATPVQNIGAYGIEVADVIESVQTFDTETLQWNELSHSDCRFGYRDSIFKQELKGRVIISSVVYKLQKKHNLHLEYGAIRDELKKRKILNPGIGDISDIVCAIRSSKLPDPKQTGNAGSFFKNPVVEEEIFKLIAANHPLVPYHRAGDGYKIPAGWLIEQAGWKGHRDGPVGCYEKQALILVNHGGANGKDVVRLANHIRASIKEKFGIDLQLEVNII